MKRDVTVKNEKRNHIRRTEMSSDDHRNEMNETVAVDAAAIAPIIAKNHHRNVQRQQKNRNHRQTIARLVRSKVTSHRLTVKVTNDQPVHRVMQMVLLLNFMILLLLGFHILFSNSIEKKILLKP